VRWGNRRRESRRLPCTGWTWLSTVEAGRWTGYGTELVHVPATLGLENGVWFQIRQDVRSVLVRNEGKVARVYLIREPAAYYYLAMTRSEWMPVLIGERF
jgi:hypothetical protein